MPTCHHWGGADGADCRDVSTDIVYKDENGHHFCLLHAPKYYVAPKGFFLGDRENYSPKSKNISKDTFDKHLETLISNQSSNPDTRIDHIYFPSNFPNSFDSYKEPERRYSFHRCHNLTSFSNSQFKAIRIHNCEMGGFHIHNLELEELTLTSTKIIKDSILRDSKIDTVSINHTTFECPFRISKIKEKNSSSNYKCSIYLNEVSFKQDVQISNIEFNDENSEFRVVNSIFERDLYYSDNKINDFINFEYCKFNGGKAYLENIDVSKIKLSRINLEYIRFTNCIFPERYEEIEIESATRAEEVYRDLKKVAFDQKDYSLVSKWHYLEKEMFLNNQKVERNHLISMFLTIYKLLSGYGEKPSQALKSLSLYLLFIVISLITLAVTHTGISTTIDWEIVRSLIYSLRDFIPFFITPTKSSLLEYISGNWGLVFVYNLIAAVGRIYCVMQVALLTFSIRNKMKR